MICRPGARSITSSGHGGAAGIWQQIHDKLREQVRETAGRNTNPSAAILDSQSVRASEAGGVRGYDSGKQIAGRKRHILVDVLGLLLLVVVTAANVQDRNGAQLLLSPLTRQFRRLRLIWADGAYAGELEAWTRGLRKWGKVRLDIVRKPKGQKGLWSCPGGGEWSGPLLGCAAIGGSAVTMSAYRKRRNR